MFQNEWFFLFLIGTSGIFNSFWILILFHLLWLFGIFIGFHILTIFSHTHIILFKSWLVITLHRGLVPLVFSMTVSNMVILIIIHWLLPEKLIWGMFGLIIIFRLNYIILSRCLVLTELLNIRWKLTNYSLVSISSWSSLSLWLLIWLFFKLKDPGSRSITN